MRRPTRTSAALAVLAGSLTLACAHGSTMGGPGAPDGPVALRFAWPENLQLFVVVAQESRRSGAQPTGLLARERMVVERKTDELWVSTRDVAARGNEPDLDSLVKIAEALVQVVALDGKFKRAEGLDQALAAADTTTPAGRDLVRSALARSTASDWEVTVGAWAGERLAPGETRRKQTQGSVPHLGTVETRLDVEYALEGRVPCADEETERRCVALTYRATLAPGDRAATLERIRRQSAGAEDPVPEDVHAEMEVELVTEPDTLVPHRMTQRERLRLRVHLPDGHVRQAEHRSEDQYLFSTRPPPAREADDASRPL